MGGFFFSLHEKEERNLRSVASWKSRTLGIGQLLPETEGGARRAVVKARSSEPAGGPSPLAYKQAEC